VQSDQAVHATDAAALEKVVVVWCIQLLRGIGLTHCSIGVWLDRNSFPRPT
jgi:hypothetical protein